MLLKHHNLHHGPINILAITYKEIIFYLYLLVTRHKPSWLLSSFMLLIRVVWCTHGSNSSTKYSHLHTLRKEILHKIAPYEIVHL